jgi:hypothetical protein
MKVDLPLSLQAQRLRGLASRPSAFTALSRDVATRPPVAGEFTSWAALCANQ